MKGVRPTKFLIIGVMSLSICLLSSSFSGLGAQNKPDVRVDPRVELMSLIFRFAGNPEYNQNLLTSYIKDVERHFKEHENHDAVQLARRLRQTRGVSFDAVMSLAIHIKDVDSMQERVPLEPAPKSWDIRWTVEDTRKFQEAARCFVKDTDFKTFIYEHHVLYRTTESRMEKILEDYGVVNWFDSFFGAKSDASFTVFLGMMNGGTCYGPRVVFPDGREELYCVLGVWLKDRKGIPRFDKSVLPTVVHEFCHSYVNPLVNQHAGDLEKAGQRIFPSVADAMRRQAYPEWRTMMYESLVRACVVRYRLASEGETAAEQQIVRENTNMFFWMRDLSSLLGEYEAHRGKYPNLDSFFPEIVKFFDNYAASIQ
ncbi:MAG: DUF4932 domain-containing protein [Candidatus Aminicenantaceae bacterium]